MKNSTEIIEATSMKAAAVQVMVGTWNQATQELIAATITRINKSVKTSVYCAVWNEATEYSPAGTITAYVQVYDQALDLYQVTIQY
jgi:hypothetical protein